MPKDREIERKYLLRSLPPECEAEHGVRIDQGYFKPGRSVRIRRSVAPGGDECYVLTRKQGHGLVREETEAEIAGDAFELLWPLTDGARISKTRYRLDGEDGLTWEIDVIDLPDGTTLHVAEVELDRAEDEPPLPDWLEPHVVRDITGERPYENASLAG